MPSPAFPLFISNPPPSFPPAEPFKRDFSKPEKLFPPLGRRRFPLSGSGVPLHFFLPHLLILFLPPVRRPCPPLPPPFDVVRRCLRPRKVTDVMSVPPSIQVCLLPPPSRLGRIERRGAEKKSELCHKLEPAANRDHPRTGGGKEDGFSVEAASKNRPICLIPPI